MKINPLMSGRGNMVALIKDANPQFTLSPAQVKITNINIRTPTSSIPFNTQAKVSGVDSNKVSGSVMIYYNRRSFLEAVTAPTSYYPITATTTFSELLNWVVTELGLVREEIEFTNFYTPPGSTVSNITIRPIADSQLYVPDILALTLVWSGPGVDQLLPYLGIGDTLHQVIHDILPTPGYF